MHACVTKEAMGRDDVDASPASIGKMLLVLEDTLTDGQLSDDDHVSHCRATAHDRTKLLHEVMELQVALAGKAKGYVAKVLAKACVGLGVEWHLEDRLVPRWHNWCKEELGNSRKLTRECLLGKGGGWGGGWGLPSKPRRQGRSHRRPRPHSQQTT